MFAFEFLQRVRNGRNTGVSVRLSVRPFVTFRCFVQTNEDTILRFSAPGRTVILVSGEIKCIRIFAGDYPQRGRQSEATPVARENFTNNRP